MQSPKPSSHCKGVEAASYFGAKQANPQNPNRTLAAQSGPLHAYSGIWEIGQRTRLGSWKGGAGNSPKVVFLGPEVCKYGPCPSSISITRDKSASASTLHREWKLSWYTMIRLSPPWLGFPLHLPTYFLKAPFLACSFLSFCLWPLTAKESFLSYDLTRYTLNQCGSSYLNPNTLWFWNIPQGRRLA